MYDEGDRSCGKKVNLKKDKGKPHDLRMSIQSTVAFIVKDSLQEKPVKGGVCRGPGDSRRECREARE